MNSQQSAWDWVPQAVSSAPTPGFEGFIQTTQAVGQPNPIIMPALNQPEKGYSAKKASKFMHFKRLEEGIKDGKAHEYMTDRRYLPDYAYIRRYEIRYLPIT